METPRALTKSSSASCQISRARPNRDDALRPNRDSARKPGSLPSGKAAAAAALCGSLGRAAGHRFSLRGLPMHS
eukprot:500961-Prymnesium_polylepis.1